MRALEYWEELRSGESDEVILAVDGPPRAACSPGFRDLAPLLDTPHAFWLARPPAGQAPATGPGDDDLGLSSYVEPWIYEAHAGGLRVRAVLGHRVGGVFAGVIAEALADRQGYAAEVLLFDPELPDPGSVVDEFHDVVSGLSRPLSTDELRSLEREVAVVVDACGDDTAALSARLRALLTGVPGLGGQELSLAALRLTALMLAEPVDVVPLWSGRTALASASPDRGLSRTRSALLVPEAAFVHREILFGHDHTGFFTSEQVARTTCDLLALSGTAR
ncbi:hypothetical protein [Streptomyces canus]|uniref:hypothetical protein n=1 Tax=Streptomyces canus TaxID=58343 RepID=UPI002DDA7251|nr:hypothetical protein [Streptomyces canus]WSD83029.1 hypothetical protein OG925_01065 [Streptomyces canus]WSD91803.1 hypothetical protein OG925_49415 [Streptomyces canus]